MKIGNTFGKSLAMAALVAVSSLAQAGPYVGVASIAAFNLAVTEVARETFESVDRGAVSAQAADGGIKGIKLFGGTGQLTQSADLAWPLNPAVIRRGASVTTLPDPNDPTSGSGRANTTAGGAYWVESDADFSVLLGRDVQAFGFFGTDFGDFEGGLAIALYNNGSEVVPDVFIDTSSNPPGSLIPTFPDSGGLTFLGYASTTMFDEIRFTIGQKPGTARDRFDIYGFDDLIVGNLKTTDGNVPEPGSLALAGLALFAAGWARKTRRSA